VADLGLHCRRAGFAGAHLQPVSRLAHCCTGLRWVCGSFEGCPPDLSCPSAADFRSSLWCQPYHAATARMAFNLTHPVLRACPADYSDPKSWEALQLPACRLLFGLSHLQSHGSPSCPADYSDPKSWEARCNCLATFCCCSTGQARRGSKYTDLSGQPQRLSSRLGNLFAMVGAADQGFCLDVLGGIAWRGWRFSQRAWGRTVRH